MGSYARMNTMEILCETRDHVAVVTLNRPAALNALSMEMVAGLRAVMGRCAVDTDVRAVLIKGAGEKAFCAGGDIRAMHHSITTGGALHQQFFTDEYRLDYYLHHYPKPYVALLDGIAMGGGLGLIQGSRLRVVGDRTRMAMPEVGIGLFPDVGGSYFLSRLPGALGTYLAMTGSPIHAADALYAGLADVYLPRAAVDGIESALCSIRWSADGSGDVSRALCDLGGPALDNLPAPALAALREAIDEHFSRASIAEILDSLEGERRPAYSDWAQRTATLMRTRSPTMLAVTLRQLQRGRSMSLADCFRMELGMMQQSFVQGDFLEGVRALIIDKDNKPRWKPDRIEDVTDTMVEAFFREHWSGATHPLAMLGE